MNQFYRVVHAILRPLLQVLFPLSVDGIENIPDGGAVLCSNHASAWDPVLLALKIPRTIPLRFMAKAELFRNPLLGWLLRKLGAFPIKRGENDLGAMKTAMKCLQDGQKLVIFPEGTRVEEEGDANAKGGAVMLATRTGVPMVPIYCGGKKLLFHGGTIIFGRPYTPVIAGRRPTPEENREIAEELVERIYALKEGSIRCR